MPRYLTKSRFKIGVDCPTKLYYCNKKNEYADNKLDDDFLESLAEGGFQVGELAKFIFSEDPIAERITIEEKDYETALKKTNERLFASESTVVAEAAFRFQNLFVRVDITRRIGNELHIYEVKAKSWNSTKDFWKSNKKGETWLDRNWIPYLYDIAFQKYVVQNAYPGLKVYAYLILANSDEPASIEGLNQLFRIKKEGGVKKVAVKDGLKRSVLGQIPLKIMPVDRECDWIYSNPAEVDLDEEYSFEEIINLFSKTYSEDQRLWSTISNKCKVCEFTNKDSDTNLKSGFAECWKHHAKLNDEELKMPLTLELWGGKAGGKSLAGEAIANGRYLLSQVEEADYLPKNITVPEAGLSATDRRRLQINKVKQNDSKCYLDKEGLIKLFDTTEPPYHFIDFETTSVALPFHSGRKPYEGIAFQYSYHLMSEKGEIEHKSQYISLEPGFPNYDFVRALKNDLHGKPGTIFRYHNHENTYLCSIYRQLRQETNQSVPDREELMEFIKDITHYDKEESWTGINDMDDLYAHVLSYYYSPWAKGSNSIKDILPAVIRDSEYIRNKYSNPIYGTQKIKSKNFENHIWIRDHINPYKTLQPVLAGYDNDDLDQFVEAVEEIAEGGAAMMAYAYLQFSDVPANQKELIKKALYRYCELDTMAMVMIWEFWGNEIGRFGNRDPDSYRE